MTSSRNSAVVLAPNGTNIVTIDLSFGDELEGLTRKSMARERGEPASKTLERIQMLMAEKPPRGRKVTREEILKTCPPVSVVDCAGAALDTSKANESFWCDAATLKLGKFTLPIRYNVPTITSLSPPPKMMVGMPALCSNVTTMFCRESVGFVVEWVLPPRAKEAAEGAEQVLSDQVVFFPGKELLGRSLLVRYRPAVDGAPWTVVETPKVMLPPAGYEQPMPRWAHTAAPAVAPAFRVVSYNILHDAFCTSNFAKKKIYPFATDEVLDLNNRRARITQELRSYNADVICLQECGKDVYERYYHRVLLAMGFESRFSCKTGNVREGLVVAVRAARFEIVSNESIALQRRALDAPEHEALARELEDHPHFADAMERITSVAAVSTVRERVTGTKFVVSNTHLFYHPHACHIRALQTYLLMSKVSAVRRAAASVGTGTESDGPVAVVMCGDFNFTRATGSYRLVTTGAVGADDNCWEKGFKFWWGVDKGLGVGGEEEAAAAAAAAADAVDAAAATPPSSPPSRPGLDAVPPTSVYAPRLGLPEGLAPFVDTHANEPTLQWTNYSLTFKEIIDHVFVSPDVRVLRTIPLPSEEEVSADVAIPSAVFPSDHVALVVDLEL